MSSSKQQQNKLLLQQRQAIIAAPSTAAAADQHHHHHHHHLAVITASAGAAAIIRTEEEAISRKRRRQLDPHHQQQYLATTTRGSNSSSSSILGEETNGCLYALRKHRCSSSSSSSSHCNAAAADDDDNKAPPQQHHNKNKRVRRRLHHRHRRPAAAAASPRILRSRIINISSSSYCFCLLLLSLLLSCCPLLLFGFSSPPASSSRSFYYRHAWNYYLSSPVILSPRHHQQLLPVSAVLVTTTTTGSTRRSAIPRHRLHAKRNKNRRDADDLNYWYENVSEDGTETTGTPDDAFWEEMERQRWASASSAPGDGTGASPVGAAAASEGMVGEIGSSPYVSAAGSSGTGSSVSSAVSSSSSSPSESAAAWSSGPTLSRTSDAIGLAAMNNPVTAASTSGYYTAGGTTSPSSSSANIRQQQAMSLKSAEATLSEYAAYAVSDNWLDEELVWMMGDDQVYHDDDEEDNNRGQRTLDDQMEEWEQEEDDNDTDDDDAWMPSDEPWDIWGEQNEKGDDSRDIDHDRDLVMTVDPKTKTRARDYLLEDDDDVEEDSHQANDEEEELKRQEAEFLEKISKIAISSRRLELARNSPKAKAFFSNRKPNAVEGYDQLWVSAIDNACFMNLKGSFRNYGIEFADNFGDWVDGNMEDGLHYTVEEIASYKARQVYDVTGLPCIACRTSFEIEPIPNLNTGAGVGVGGAAAAASSSSPPGYSNNPRVASGYRFNDIGMHVDYVCDALRPLSEPSRVTQFKTCLCYYDGAVEVFDYGVAEVDLVFANSLRTYIPVSQAINEMIKTLELTFGLQYQPWLQKRVDETRMAGIGPASMKLRDRVLKEGRVLPNDIIDVSEFMDSQVDVNLMDECARELSNRFLNEKPTKILTVATTGLVIALPMAKYLQVPLVYARKERNVVMADTYKAAYSSKTVGKNRELLVSKSHLDPDDRVLVVDDFLSGGSSQEALLRIIAESGAQCVGIGVLLEKVYDSGRQSLSGFDVPTHSLCRVASVKNGVIQLVEEEGYDRM